ncbi:MULTISPECIES: aldehyde oxidoreductase molybdenum-binding subunit PaoC [unclassified Halomonas]|uniref:aldehyde oxidoreductase molybdenum-binding subunit PaoC n=1 Tax=unclassified Halomonas TaxID=2609666 RepID=UPI00209FD7E4|nr:MULTISPECIES: aldehyde oxidoreductase molybdenum-binding subunit PaoC [unclassified Halomonas]MCP1313280.1 xanthine dehydrogenase family protein molybdopterin-binding subunit [Halomonas sp. 707D7]MCP1326887.1 xanthine dehydrogenase family protein molybdopterin-binding subunit [Halomonas sp. 707D4]
MDFNQSADENLFDRARIIGKPHTRIDGALKVTGTAPYAYERNDVVENHLVGYPLGASIAKGRITRMDASAARNAEGVAAVITALDIDELPRADSNVAKLFGGDIVEHYHQAIAVVVADTLEQARAATSLIEVEYEEMPGEFDLDDAWKRLQDRDVINEVGDVDAAFERAEVSIDETYHTASQSHAMMEPHASIADWCDGKHLTLWTSNQMIAWSKKALATTLELDEANIRLESPYIGGGFGGKLWLRADAVLAALGSRETGRPVKVALPRPLIFNNATHRSGTVQRLRIAANRDGRITAFDHSAISHTLPGGSGEDAVNQTRCFYAGENRRVAHHAIDMNLPEAADMRAPGEASGLAVLEIAMDEMAEKLGLDPVEFRILNDTQVNPEEPEKRFSDRHFVECLQKGAEAFGWSERNRTPGGRREGQWLIGQGMAGAYRGSPTLDSGARVSLNQGRLVVETDMTDIGTGSYTIIAQTAAETMGVELEDVEVRLGNSAYPKASGSGGQMGAASATAGVYAACLALQAEIGKRLGVDNARFEQGRVRAEGIDTPLAEVAGGDEIVGEDTLHFGDFKDKLEIGTFGAHFVEVAVHAYTGETRLRRTLSVCDAGRILNPVTARSQVIGGMTMAIGAALSESLSIDTARGFFPNHDLAGYEIAVHADIPEQEVIFLDTQDGASTPLKAKGVGELGICGGAAAVANAMYNATGIRLRDYPLTLDRMLDQLPAI